MENTTEKSRNAWCWGFTPQAELWNGRLAMIGFLAVVLIEVFGGEGFLHFFDIL
ncbi:MAG: chlorophyll a/b-binding protein [Cyanobacteria bacterium P01_D01_bin.50]